MPDRAFPFHAESSAIAQAPVDRVFAHLDDPKALAEHMSRSSGMTMGSRMSIGVDAGGGHAVGSKIGMRGRMLGLALSLDEVVTEREPPVKKTWQTVGTPRLLVIAQYRMGFELKEQRGASVVRVFIDYSLPNTPPGSWLGYVLGAVYARWCTNQMVMCVARRFT